MQTLYADIYLLLNFTVDILSLHFAAAFAKVTLSRVRLILLSALFSAAALLFVLLFDFLWLVVVGNLLVILSVIFIASGRVGVLRRVKLAVAFYALMTLIGGITSALYNLIYSYIPREEYDEGINRTLLLVAAAVLLAFGVIKMTLSLFSGCIKERFVELELEMPMGSTRFSALVDSGNLLSDPMDSTPVVLVKEAAARQLFVGGAPNFKLGIPRELERYLRIIPIKGREGTRIEYAIRPLSAHVYYGKKKRRVRILFIIDFEEGSFGGYDGLIGTSALDGIL